MMTPRRVVWVLLVAMLLTGCSMMRQILGFGPSNDPTVNIRPAETRWLLIKNPRFGDVPSEPEYVWVEEDKIPFTVRGMFNKKALIAPPEVVAKYGGPPGGGRISPRQGMPYQVNEPGTTIAAVTAPLPTGTRPPGARPAAAVEAPKRGYVIWVDTTRVVIDLTSQDGIKLGSLISLRRDKIPIVHPVTGELLGELDEEVATARVVETRDKFSVAEIEKVAGGLNVQVKDRVVLK